LIGWNDVTGLVSSKGWQLSQACGLIFDKPNHCSSEMRFVSGSVNVHVEGSLSYPFDVIP